MLDSANAFIRWRLMAESCPPGCSRIVEQPNLSD
jgi:hypothetical protein